MSGVVDGALEGGGEGALSVYCNFNEVVIFESVLFGYDSCQVRVLAVGVVFPHPVRVSEDGVAEGNECDVEGCVPRDVRAFGGYLCGVRVVCVGDVSDEG